MASFFQDLWESIFTPGPTPTLLVATNVTFAALQVVLAILLYATFSVHFVVLSVICGGLWYSINWFAAELVIHRIQEEEKERRAKAATVPQAATSASSADESETEVEGTAESTASLQRGRPGGSRQSPAPPRPVATGAEAQPEQPQGQAELKHRVVDHETLSPSPSSQGLKSGVSTEDEWEKVSENEKEK